MKSSSFPFTCVVQMRKNLKLRIYVETTHFFSTDMFTVWVLHTEDQEAGGCIIMRNIRQKNWQKLIDSYQTPLFILIFCFTHKQIPYQLDHVPFKSSQRARCTSHLGTTKMLDLEIIITGVKLFPLQTFDQPLIFLLQ